MAKQQRKRSKPQKSAEPTVSQQRQAYYEARARRQSLTELGVTEEKPPRPPADAKAALEALDSFDRLMILYGICRWTAIAGQPPEPEDWEGDRDWPQPDAVETLFGSWDAALSEAGAVASQGPALPHRVAHPQHGRRTLPRDLQHGQHRVGERDPRRP